MPNPPTAAVSPPNVSRSALRVVLFGMPDAGKSSLLGALSQAAQTQEHVLNGHLTDLGRGLAEMQRRLYEETGRNTAEEVLPFPVAFQSFAARQRSDAVLIDCDGRVANDLLSGKRRFDVKGGGELGRAISHADEVVFVVDVSASEGQINADLTECARFLRLLEERRGERVEVGGLPVFLVLTKCDLLARPGDDLAGWVEKVEERKRDVGRRFQSFLERETHNFGSIQLNVWATAVRRPELADSPAKPREPYGVAELFRQGFAQAEQHRRRRGRSSWRLLLVVLGALIGLGALVAVPALLVLYRPSEEAVDLETQVRQFRSREETLSPASRYRDTQDRMGWLEAYRHDSGYSELPDELKSYVDTRMQDLKDYEAFASAVDKVPDARAARTLPKVKEAVDAVTQVDKTLDAHPDWKSTDAGRLLEERRDDAQALERAVQTVAGGYENVIREGQQVIKESNKPNLPSRARKVLDAANALPTEKADATKQLPGSTRLTYAAVFAFDPVKDAIKRWEGVQRDLEFLAKLGKP